MTLFKKLGLFVVAALALTASSVFAKEIRWTSAEEAKNSIREDDDPAELYKIQFKTSALTEEEAQTALNPAIQTLKEFFPGQVTATSFESSNSPGQIWIDVKINVGDCYRRSMIQRFNRTEELSVVTINEDFNNYIHGVLDPLLEKKIAHLSVPESGSHYYDNITLFINHVMEPTPSGVNWKELCRPEKSK